MHQLSDKSKTQEVSQPSFLREYEYHSSVHSMHGGYVSVSEQPIKTQWQVADAGNNAIPTNHSIYGIRVGFNGLTHLSLVIAFAAASNNAIPTRRQQ